ncbi:MAG TPA: LemA family protein [Candidatus Saccharimonadales bacterium]|jgi:LemA protein|nr:LemA family protein [Candidatus Saccharimonadales bacterium]
MIIVIVIAVVVVLLLIFGAMYNGLVKLNVQAQEAWSDITVQLKRRYDLIPNLVNTVKGYATHEKSIFEDLANARAKALGAQGVEETAKAENQFQQTLKSLFAVAENYPDLKASQNFQQLQDQLTDTEDKIQASRRFYNGVVRDFNTKRKVFPTNIFANMLGFKQDKPFFELDEAETAAVQQPVNVKF